MTSSPVEFGCLGSVRLADAAGSPIEPVLAQPKRLALLAYLLLADPEAAQSRDALTGLFWPDSTEEKARTSLRQALRYLRRELGSEVILSRGRSWVGADCERISCDLWRLEARLEAGEAAAALELYQGELLQGFELRGCPDFDHWLDVRRRGLALRMATVAGELAESARDAGDAPAALCFARRALEIGEATEDEVRRLMGIQLWAGDRAGALLTYEQFERRLAEHFHATPSLRTRELAERARGSAAATTSARPQVAPVADVPADPAAADLTAPPSPGRWRRRMLPAGVVLSALVSAGLLYAATRDTGVGGVLDGEAMEAPPELLIFPFEVRAADPALNVLREGMAELLAPIFTGAAGPRARQPEGDWAEAGAGGNAADAVRRARAAGADWFVTGRVHGDDRQVHLQAALGDVTGRRQTVRTSLSGPSDSVYVLARELGGRLLAVAGGASEDEAILLGRHSPPAIHMYLLGRSAYRAGRYDEADRNYRAALRHDSLFAQAALGLVETHLSAPWLHGHTFTTALPLAFRLRERLSPADQEVVTAVAGPWHPGPSTQAEHYHAWEEAVKQAPDRAEVWYQWGDALYHVGPYIGIPDALRRAERAFRRTLELDSAYLPPLGHLTEMAIEAGDVGRARAYLQRLLASSPEPVNADYLRWRVALGAGDQQELQRLRARFPEMNTVSLGGIVASAQFTGQGLEDAERIARLGEFRWESSAQRRRMLETLHFYELNRGRQSRARSWLDDQAAGGVENRANLHLVIRDALLADGAEQPAAEAAEQLGAVVAASPTAPAPADVCAMEAWKLYNGDVSTIRRSLATLRAQGSQVEETLDRRPLWCAAYLEGLLAIHEGGDLMRAAAVLRDLAFQGAAPPGVYADSPRLTGIGLLAAQGELEAALTISRFRGSVPYALTSFLRHEGRLAAMAGDTAAALRAYEHYLTLRSAPEPPLVPQRDSVLDEYRALRAAGAARSPRS